MGGMRRQGSSAPPPLTGHAKEFPFRLVYGAAVTEDDLEWLGRRAMEWAR